jgi:hypothetical protein
MDIATARRPAPHNPICLVSLVPNGVKIQAWSLRLVAGGWQIFENLDLSARWVLIQGACAHEIFRKEGQIPLIPRHVLSKG